MQTLCTYILVFALTVLSMNVALAEEFDPVADLQSGDTFLGVDLPEDFDPEPDAVSADYPVTTVPEDSAPSSTPQFTEAGTGSGGILETASTPTETAALGYRPNVPPFNGQPLMTSLATVAPVVSYESAPSEVPAFSYKAYLTNPELAPTGPEAAVTLALLTALGVTLFYFRKKTKLFDA